MQLSKLYAVDMHEFDGVIFDTENNKAWLQLMRDEVEHGEDGYDLR